MNSFRQMLTHDARNGIDIQAGFGRNRHDIKEVHLACQELQVRQQIGFFLNVVYFVHSQNNRGFAITQLVEHHFVVRRPAGAFHNENNQFNITDRAARRFIHQAVDRSFFFHMQARSININRLIRAFSMDANNTVTCCLSLT